MAYSLIIADDEAIMRNGLSNLFNWDEIGFKVTGVFSDGQEVIGHLRQNMVDCILTDICMPFASGLDIARFIHESKLPTRLVIISGHKDFAYAQKAVEYNVEHFLLKPLALPELRKVFLSVKDKLDRQHHENNAMQFRQEQYSRLVNFVEQQFMTDLVLGTLREDTAFWQRVSLFGYRQDDIDRQCLLFTVTADDPTADGFIREYGQNGLAQHLSSILNIIDRNWSFFQIRMDQLAFQGLYVEKMHEAAPLFGGQDFSSFTGHVADAIYSMSGIRVHVVLEQVFDSLYHLSKYQQKPVTGEIVSAATSSRAFFGHVREQKKLLCSYIQQLDETSALGLFASFVSQCLQAGLPVAQNQVIHLFNLVSIQLAGDDNDLQQKLEALLPYVAVSRLQTADELIAWGSAWISQVIAAVKAHAAQADYHENTLDKVKRYIEENYHRDISLGETAEQVYLNPVYLSRMFKERTGQTFVEYLTEVRIRTAKQLLAAPDLYVYDICSRVGYNNLKYFYRLFKKETGSSPTEYRDQILSTRIDPTLVDGQETAPRPER
jgi:two-component system response regulator YesN